jgi:hypothetical protein
MTVTSNRMKTLKLLVGVASRNPYYSAPRNSYLDDKQQSEHSPRSNRDSLQKFEKNFAHAHPAILHLRAVGGDITIVIVLLCSDS